MTDTLPELLPCPFCEYTGAWPVHIQDQDHSLWDTYCIRCMCGAEGATKKTAALARESWNTRAPDQAAADERDRLRVEVEALQDKLSKNTEVYLMTCKSQLSVMHERDALQAEVEALRKDAELWRNRVTEAHREREAAVSAHEAAQRAGFQFRDEVIALRKRMAKMRNALEEVCTVLETNTTAIVDTVWVSTGAPETLLDHCRASVLDDGGTK